MQQKIINYDWENATGDVTLTQYGKGRSLLHVACPLRITCSLHQSARPQNQIATGCLPYAEISRVQMTHA